MKKRVDYYVKNVFVETGNGGYIQFIRHFWLCSRKIKISFASKKAIEITKFALDYL